MTKKQIKLSEKEIVRRINDNYVIIIYENLGYGYDGTLSFSNEINSQLNGEGYYKKLDEKVI